MLSLSERQFKYLDILTDKLIKFMNTYALQLEMFNKYFNWKLASKKHAETT